MTDTTHKGLADALLAFQAEAPTLPKDATNPHFKSKYTPLDTIIETVNPLLSKHGLVWTTLPGFVPESGQPTLTYRIEHAPTKEKLEGVMPLLLGKQDSQGLGSALTYSRRYALTSVLNLATDEDDDGNAASRPRQQAATTNGSTVTTEDADAIKAALRGMKPEQIQLAFAALGLDPTKPIRTIPRAKAVPLVKALAEAAA